MKNEASRPRQAKALRSSVAGLLFAAVMAGAHSGDEPSRGSRTPRAIAPFGEGVTPSLPWREELLPNQRIPRTEFSLREVDGRRVLEVRARASFGDLTHPLNAGGSPGELAWTWRVGRFAAGADLRQKRGDDNAIKVCALFDLPLDRTPRFERFMLKRARGSARRHLPGATVCYVWDSSLPVGTRLPNPFSKRLRYMVLRQGIGGTNPWLDESRDLGKDFLDLFGHESGGVVPELLGISIGGDSDNTGGESVAWITGVIHRPAP